MKLPLSSLHFGHNVQMRCVYPSMVLLSQLYAHQDRASKWSYYSSTGRLGSDRITVSPLASGGLPHSKCSKTDSALSSSRSEDTTQRNNTHQQTVWKNS